MEDENGLELSLGLSCGGSSGKSEGRDVPSDTTLDEGSSSKLLGGNITASDVSFKNFFQTSAENQVHSGKQKSDPVSQPHENFWTDLGKHAANVANVSKDVQSSQSQFTRYQQWWIPTNKTTDIEEEKSGINKRKLSFEEINIQKKHEKVVVKPVKVPTTSGVPNATGFPSPSVMQLMPLTNNERPVVQTMNASNLQLAFGYSPVQLPTLERSSSWAFGSQPQHASSFDIKDNADGASQHSEDDVKRSHASSYEGNRSELAKCSGKHIGEAGASSSSQVEEEGKGSNTIFRETTNQPVAESFSHEGCAIRRGMLASNFKFGGCGSCPDLPWVSTTGPGPNGKTISGVTYQYDGNQRKIVCACHGSHMTEEEFIQHAGADASNEDNNANLASFPANNPAASAQN